MSDVHNNHLKIVENNWRSKSGKKKESDKESDKECVRKEEERERVWERESERQRKERNLIHIERNTQ